MVQFKDYDGGLEAGRRLASASKEDEVVISGLAGVYPDSENVVDFGQKLFNKVDLISDDDRRWKLDHPEIPQRTGKLLELTKFDASFFGLHYNQAQSMDPMCRLLLERAYEAVIDAGVNPATIKGTNTGVFIGICFSESEKTWFYEKLQAQGFGATGCVRSMTANRISYWLGVNGPSYTVDTACSSGMYALEQGYKAIRTGQCDAAIVAACNLCLHPYVSLQFSRLGVLSMDGRCKVFDEAANGYCRSEAACVVYLQRHKDAKRIYSTIVHSKTNCDGYKEEGITYPSGQVQQQLLIDFYKECQVNPSELAWVEAHGTGTRVGDPEELNAIVNVLCKDRKSKLKVGSVKSNIGHSEPVSGLCSITKVIIAMETGLIPPNINYNTPRKDIEHLLTNVVEVVTEPTPWEGGMVGVNSFGFGGANCHTLLKWNEKSKMNHGIPDDNMPRLVTLSGRTEHAVNFLINQLENMKMDAEFIALFHEIHKDLIPGHLYRGYVILNKNAGSSAKLVKKQWGENEIVYHFPGLFSQIQPMDSSILDISFITSLLEELSSYVKIDLIRLLKNQSQENDSLIVNFLKITSYQICLVKLLNILGVKADKMTGSSIGNIACAYADGLISEKDAILISYNTALAITESKPPNGVVIHVGANTKDIGEIHENLNIYQFGIKNSIITGPKDLVIKLSNKLTSNGITVTQMNTSNVPLHSKLLKDAHQNITTRLQKIFPNPKKSSTKWLNKSINYEYFSSIIFTKIENNLQNLISNDDIIILHFGPPCKITQNIFTSNGIYLLEKNDQKFNLFTALLDNLGRLHLEGVDLDIGKLYPKIEFPVSRSTPMISPLVKWNHTEHWYVPTYKSQKMIKAGERSVNISLKEEEMEYIAGHCVDGRNLFPATGYLWLVWDTLSMLRGKSFFEMPVVFENVRFHRATNLTKDGSIDFIVVIQKVSGKFEIVESGTAIVTGKTYIPEDVNEEMINICAKETPDEFVLSSKDIYKELRLRGYQYKGLFRSLTNLTLDASCGKITWHNNWVTFMDNMLQLKILSVDTRSLYVPTAIDRLTVDPKHHLQLTGQLPADNKDMDVYYYKHLDVVKSGGIEIRGIQANSISRKKRLSEAVLEKNIFVPYHETEEVYTIDQIVRIMTQIVLENEETISTKVVEYSAHPIQILAPIVAQVLSDLPLIQPDITVLSTGTNPQLDDLPPEIAVEDKKISSSKAVLIAVASDLTQEEKTEILQNCLSILKDGGFIITNEALGTTFDMEGLITVASYPCNQRSIILLRKAPLIDITQSEILKFDSDNFAWVANLQKLISSKDTKRVIIYSEKQKYNGLLGFMNCLRKEGDGKKARGVLIMDENLPEFSIDNDIFTDMLKKDLAVNVYKNGAWGTYRHLKIDPHKLVKAKYAYVNVGTRGDLSSLAWYQGNLSTRIRGYKGSQLVNVQYCALNFRDIMLATNKLNPDVITASRIEQECVIGFEYAGFIEDGTAVIGFCENRGMCTQVIPTYDFIWEVPDCLTLEEAATIPVVYGTVIYGFFVQGCIKKGDTVLIHSGTGGVGQAAINIALYVGCRVLTTVGTPEKRQFIKDHFPQIAEEDIGNSRDTSFEQMVMKSTNGRGVDIVLNSLADDKLFASVRCLAKGGRFLEIGKFDISKNTQLGMDLFRKGASFHGVMLDGIYDSSEDTRVSIKNMMKEFLEKGVLKPLNRTVFNRDQLEQAFRYMATGKHMGKVLIKVFDLPPEQIISQKNVIEAKARFHCLDDKSYIVAGGLGGFGLELSDWLVLRGCKNLILNSRKGVVNGYQSMRINIWREYGANVQISTDDITCEEGARNLLLNAAKHGPVGGIFNLAVVLSDGLFENMSEETFNVSAGPKARATVYLDKLSRQLCPELDHFVVFSSVSCGRGNLGQTNYGFSNSVMERVMEARREDNLPALAIQWGAVGDVGLVANMNDQNIEVVIGGTLQQPISNCLQVLDTFLCQPEAIVSSVVVAEKKSSSSANNIVDTVVNILGLTDLKNVSQHSTLAEIGMDSMMAVEIKQTLEREFEVFLSPQDIRSMTFAKLHEISAARESGTALETGATAEETKENIIDLNLLINLIGEEPAVFEPCIRLNSAISSDTPCQHKTFLIPGIEGSPVIMEGVAKVLCSETYGIVFDYKKGNESIEDIAKDVYDVILEDVKKRGTFNIVGYSYGGVVALHTTYLLELAGFTGKLLLIDSSQELMKELLVAIIGKDDDLLQQKLVLRGVDLLIPKKKTLFEKELEKAKTLDERLDLIISFGEGEVKLSPQYQRDILFSLYKRIKSTQFYNGFPDHVLQSNVSLIRPLVATLPISDDYGLSKYCKNEVEVHYAEGNHLTIMANQKVGELVNTIFGYEQIDTDKTKNIFLPPNANHIKGIN